MWKTVHGRARMLVALVAIAVIATACDPSQWDVGGSERPFFCDPTDLEINDGHGAGHGHESPYTEEKGPLSALDCLAVDVTIQFGLNVAEQFPTAAIAEANGWYQIAPWIPGQGTHHLHLGHGIPASFDPLRPTMLMYDNNGPTGALTGMVWAVASGHEPPEGFRGDNDHWHAHQALCIRDGGIVGDGLTDEECAAIGGVNLDASGLWLVHVWLPEYAGWQATDIFNKEHPGIVEPAA